MAYQEAELAEDYRYSETQSDVYASAYGEAEAIAEALEDEE